MTTKRPILPRGRPSGALGVSTLACLVCLTLFGSAGCNEEVTTRRPLNAEQAKRLRMARSNYERRLIRAEPSMTEKEKADLAKKLAKSKQQKPRKRR
jgi:hypothetical protein